jgi:hypothetical protein
VTTIPEKKRPFDILAGFLIIMLGVAAFRAAQGPQGGQGAPVVAAVIGILALGILVVWLDWRRKPAAVLAISPEEIFFGRLDQPGLRIARDASGRLRFHQGFINRRMSGWYLKLADAPDQPGILMTGFDMPEVKRACVAQGWTFD